MLKLLLTHWRAHHKQAPEDLTFEPFYLTDPIIGRTETTNPYSVNRINPIYESDSKSSVTPPGGRPATSGEMAGDLPPPPPPKPVVARGGILRNAGSRTNIAEVKNQSTTTEEEEMNGVTRLDCAKDELPRSTESSSKASTPPNPSEDSGITRGDQASSDSPSEINVSKTETSRRRYSRHVGPRACKKCRRYQQKPGGKWSCDDYYKKAILEDRSYPDGWTSDLSNDICPSCDQFQRSRNRSSFHVLSTMPEREESTRFPPDGSPADPPTIEERNGKHRGCPCGRWYDVLSEREKYDRLSPDPYFWPGPCLCGSTASLYYSQKRKVKFAGEAKKEDTNEQPKVPPEVEEDIKDAKTLDATEESKTINEKSRKALTLESLQRNYPWNMEGWDVLLRQRILQKRRRRAFYMGIMALTLVIFVGLVVAIVLIYLRRRNA